MELTLKDKDFLERLRRLVESKDLSIELKQDGVKRLVLRQKPHNQYRKAASRVADAVEGAAQARHGIAGFSVRGDFPATTSPAPKKV